MLPSTTTPAKDSYKIKNWKVYTKALVQPGSLTLWIGDSLPGTWREIDAAKKVVGECLYGDCLIQCCLLLGKAYHQPLRQTTGFVSGSELKPVVHGYTNHDGPSRLCGARLQHPFPQTGFPGCRGEQGFNK